MIFCRKRIDAERLFNAVETWLHDRLGLEISPEKSKIINLKKKPCEFLGFTLKAVRKGVHKDGATKYVVESHMSAKSKKRVEKEAQELIKDLQNAQGPIDMLRKVNRYNSFVIGVHNYYQIATHISLDVHEIAFHLSRTLYNRLGERLKGMGIRYQPTWQGTKTANRLAT